MKKIAFIFPGQGHSTLAWEKIFMRLSHVQKK